jgi:hypothetical protein
MKHIHKINESPDNLHYKDVNYEWMDDEARAFGYFRETATMIISNYGSTHPDYLADYFDDNDFCSNKECVSPHFDYPGRIWDEVKIISFWEYPNNIEDMKDVINELEKASGLEIWDNGYKLEIPIEDGEDITDTIDYDWIEDSIFIPLEEFKQSKNFSEKERLQHFMNWDKKSKLKKNIGFGSDSKKGRQSLKYKQALLKSESINLKNSKIIYKPMITKFKIFEEEEIEVHVPLVELYVLYSTSNDNQILFRDNNGGYLFLPSDSKNQQFDMVIFNDFDEAQKFIGEKPELKLIILPLRT